jgi:nucleotide-binding universal stress UspA family protein
MYGRMRVAIDAALNSPDNSLRRTIQFAKMSGATVYLLHVARGHVVASDISAGSGLGVLAGEDDVDAREREIVQRAVDEMAQAGIPVHGELVNATEHDAAEVIVQRARELQVDLIVMGYQHYRGSPVADRVIHQELHCSILLARPPD